MTHSAFVRKGRKISKYMCLDLYKNGRGACFDRYKNGDGEEIIDLNLVVEVRWDGVEAGVGAVRLALPVRPLALARRGALWQGRFKSDNALQVGAHFGL